MEILKKIHKKKPKNLWKDYFESGKYKLHSSTTKLDEKDESVVFIGDLEKRKQAYGICGECNEPGTGDQWCRPCNAKRFTENFKTWTSGNKDIDEFIQHSQLNAVHYTKCLEWVPFENFQDVTYITRGGFGKIHSAEWPEGYICYWDIKNQKWYKDTNTKVALKSFDNSSDISTDFLNEIKSHLQIDILDVIQCYGITQHPDTKDYMMVLKFCSDGNLRNYLNNFKICPNSYTSKIHILLQIARGLLDIHNAGKVHKDFHSGNILFVDGPYISDLGMCQPANNEERSVNKEGVYGVLPYMAPEVLCGYEYTKAADIYSFGIVMNELMSEEFPFSDIPHNHILGVKICKGLRPKISKDTPKLLADLIMKCWDAEAVNRPTAYELYQILHKWDDEKFKDSEIHSQTKECEKIRKNEMKNMLNENRSNDDTQTHPQAIYTSRLINFKNLPKPMNSSDLLSFQINSDTILPTLADPISECLDCELSESDLNETG